LILVFSENVFGSEYLKKRYWDIEELANHFVRGAVEGSGDI
jgi:hypothetical protein